MSDKHTVGTYLCTFVHMDIQHSARLSEYVQVFSRIFSEVMAFKAI